MKILSASSFKPLSVEKKMVEKGYKLSVENLLKNCSQYGIQAAGSVGVESQTKNYTSLYPRDIGISSLGILVSGNEKLIDKLKTSLIYLTKAQSPLGQFPFNYKPESYNSRWWNPGAIDSTLWWCISFLLYYKETKDVTFFKSYSASLEKAFTWLMYQDTNNDSLLEQGEASDWADEMPRHGTVLYTNTLWYWLVKLRVEMEKKRELKELQDNIHEAFNTLLWIHKESSNNTDYMPKNDFLTKNPTRKNDIEFTNSQIVYLPYYLGYLAHRSYEQRCDVLGNILACLTGLADKYKSALITDEILRAGMNLPYPVKALHPSIYPGEKDWKDYMTKNRQNYPGQYHNGGIWPFIGGLWVIWLTQFNKPLAKQELSKLALANSQNDWEFNEFLHGENGTPMGVPYQTWNMGTYIAAYKAVNKNITLF